MFSIGASQVEDVRRYIAEQEQHHRKLSFQDEFRLLLKRYELAYDVKGLHHLGTIQPFQGNGAYIRQVSLSSSSSSSCSSSFLGHFRGRVRERG